MKQRVTLYGSYTLAVEFEDLVATVGSPPSDEIIRAFYRVLEDHYDTRLIAVTYDRQNEMLLITVKTFDAARDVQKTWEELLTFVCEDPGWADWAPGQG